jgi:ABC-type branched-subunit amino acid transport system substrate-binding protein
MRRQDVQRIDTWILVGALIAALAVVGIWRPLVRAAQPVRIGFGMALTGGLAANGKAALLAMEIWRDDVNKAGGSSDGQWSSFTTTIRASQRLSLASIRSCSMSIR